MLGVGWATRLPHLTPGVGGEILRPLHRAVEAGHALLAKFFVERMRQEEVAVNLGGEVSFKHELLHLSVARGFHSVTEVLLRDGAEVRAVQAGLGDDFVSPLHSAARSGHLPLVTRLLRAGAETTASSAQHELSASHLAARGGHGTVLEMILGSGGNFIYRDTYLVKVVPLFPMRDLDSFRSVLR